MFLFPSFKRIESQQLFFAFYLFFEIERKMLVVLITGILGTQTSGGSLIVDSINFTFSPCTFRCTLPAKALFCSPPPPPNFFWKISENIIKNRFEYNPESLSFKLILKVIVKDSDTNFVHTFSLSNHAFLMKKSTASCFKSSIDT